MNVWVNRSWVIVTLALLLAACSSTPKKAATDDADSGAATSMPETSMSDSDMGMSDASTGAVGGAGTFSGDPLSDPNSLLSKRVIYFDYDSAVVRDDFTAVVEAHASYLADNPGVRITLEGHADERGTREYNLGLGDRRANAVHQFLSLMGARAGQVQTVSYGEERPALDGHDESAWSQNRRVEIVYTQ